MAAKNIKGEGEKGEKGEKGETKMESEEMKLTNKMAKYSENMVDFFKEYEQTLIKCKVPELKNIAKSYKLKISGTKQEVVTRITTFLKSSIAILKIQKVFRGWLQRNCNILHGPAYKCREICTNETDFLSGDELKLITNNQFFSYTDIDNFTYGFDIISLYNLILKSKDGMMGQGVKNPYNRNIIGSSIINNFNKLLRISKALKKSIIVHMETVEVSQEKTIELRIIELFQQINALGNYSEFSWFLSLNRLQLIKFTRELGDIWYYRAQITNETKHLICPSGDPFNFVNFNYLVNEPSIDRIRNIILRLLEKMINSGINRDNKALGTFYILGALTLVNTDAAASLPWLYQSFAYF